jgi:hypothetical protein
MHSNTVRSKIKKIETAMINTLQLAARKNLPTTCLDYFVFPYLKNNVFKNGPGTIPELMQIITDNCNLTDVPTLRRSFENMKGRE